MSIEELTRKVEEQISNRTHAETVEMLKESKIIDNQGYLHEHYFSREDVTESRKNKPIK